MLPQPVTVTDELLAAVHAELVGLRADLASAGGLPDGELRSLPLTHGQGTEPSPPKPRARKPPANRPKQVPDD